MGADSFAALRLWHRAAEIPFAATLVVASRPGESLDNLEAALPEGLTIETVKGTGISPYIGSSKRAEALAPAEPIDLRCYTLRNPNGTQAPFYLLPGLEIEISASQIRQQLRAPAYVPQAEARLLPSAVSDYIRAHGLYR